MESRTEAGIEGSVEMNEEFNYIGICFQKCIECGDFLGEFDTIDYCDYKCTVDRIIRLGLDEAKKRSLKIEQ